MTISLYVFGICVFEFTIGAAATEDDAAALNCGTTASYPVGFTAAFEMPDEMPLPMRNNGWGDEGNRL